MVFGKRMMHREVEFMWQIPTILGMSNDDVDDEGGILANKMAEVIKLKTEVDQK